MPTQDAVDLSPPSFQQVHTLLLAIALRARSRQQRLATAESCTGGLVAALCTSLAGSSEWFECGLVTYSLLAKQQLLGIDAALLARFGSVSEPIIRDMALGVLRRSNATLAVAVTGIAGPAGGDVDRPVGTVWFAWAGRNPGGAAPEILQTLAHQFNGDREFIRQCAATTALQGLLQALS